GLARVTHFLAERTELGGVRIVEREIVDVGCGEIGVEAGGGLPVAVGGDRGQGAWTDLPVGLQRHAGVADVLAVALVRIGVSGVGIVGIAVVAAECGDELLARVAAY